MTEALDDMRTRVPAVAIACSRRFKAGGSVQVTCLQSDDQIYQEDGQDGQRNKTREIREEEREAVADDSPDTEGRPLGSDRSHANTSARLSTLAPSLISRSRA